MTDNRITNYFTNLLKTFLDKGTIAPPDQTIKEWDQNPEIKELFDLVETLLKRYHTGNAAIRSIADGNLNFNVPEDIPVLAPVKALQSKLKHLIYQTQQIAEGDYTQHIDFIGDFSSSFNYLIDSLKEQKKLERQLSESQKKYKLIAENATDVIWTIAIDSQKITFISPSVFNLTGYTVEEVIEKGFKLFLLPDSIEKEMNYYYLVKEKINNHDPLINENERYQLRHKEGRIVDIETYTSIIFTDEGIPDQILGITRDITSRIASERSLTASEAKLATLLAQQTTQNKQLLTRVQYIFNSSINAIGFFDIDGETIRFSGCNERWAKALGKTPDELDGLDINRLNDDETTSLYRKYLLKAVDSRQPVEDYLYWHEMYFHAIIIPIVENPESIITSCGVIIYNITDKIRAEKRMQESEDRFMSIFNNSKDAIALFSTKLEIIDVNDSFIQLHGSPNFFTANIIENYFPLRYHKMVSTMVDNVKGGISVPTFECEVYRHDKSLVPVEISTSTITLNNTPLLLCFIRDISAHKEMERMMATVGTQIETRERQKLAADLHDNIGPLLSSMNMYMSVLSRKEELQPYSGTVNDVRRILKDAIASVREISNNLNPQLLQRFGLTAALNHFFETKKKLIKIDLKNTIDDLRFSELQETMIYNIIKEAFNNSLKYSDAEQITLTINHENEVMYITYSDNGIGFDMEEKMKNIGNSMGLFSIINRVKILNGNYTIETSPGNGFLLKIDFHIKH